MIPAIFKPWLVRWDLTPDGEAFSTAYHNHLMPVRRGRERAMLKIAMGQEEREGAGLMSWWAGDGAARVLAHQDEALLMERCEGPRSLVEMACSGADDEASEILCAAARRLHAPRPGPRPTMLVPLPVWFRQLEPAAAREGGVLALAASAARDLLASPRDGKVLHGDLHHGNVLDGGARGWLAIDPKGLFGERGFDFGAIFWNPDSGFHDGDRPPVATLPGRLARRIAVISRAADLEPARLLRWVLAYAGLSAAWDLDDGGRPRVALTVARIAAAELGL